jgi:hypothetical protein
VVCLRHQTDSQLGLVEWLAIGTRQHRRDEGQRRPVILPTMETWRVQLKQLRGLAADLRWPCLYQDQNQDNDQNDHQYADGQM